MQQSNLEPFLKTGTTLAVLSIDGKEPEEKERLNKSASCLEISCFRRIKILFGILKVVVKIVGKIVVKDVSNFTRVSDCIFTMRERSKYS